MKTKLMFAVVVLVLAALALYILQEPKDSSQTTISIGVITPLTGGVAYWGESSLAGLKLAEKDLKEKGIDVRILTEDGQLDPKTALNAAQKLVNVDKVDALYTEFNPAAIAVSSFLKDKDMVQIYDAAPISPLKESKNFFKTYLDYHASCEEIATLLKERGYKRLGVLKMNLEHGDLCVEGLRTVFGDSMMVESYNSGMSDFRTQLSKLDSSGADVLVHASFQPETIASLKNMRELGLEQPFVGLMETMTPEVTQEFGDVLDGAVVFGMPEVSSDLIARIEAASGTKVIDQNAAALAYLHVTQLAEALDACKKETACVRSKLEKAAPDPVAGFQGFHNRVAAFDTLVREWKDGQFVTVH